MRRVWDAFHVWVKLAGCLVLINWVAVSWFLPRWVAPRYGDGHPTFHMQRAWVALTLDAVQLQREVGALRVVLVGDSSIASVGGGWGGELGPPLAARLREALPGRPIEVIDLSTVGTYASDG